MSNVSSIEAECPTLRDCRRAEILANVLRRGATMLRKAHRRFGCDPDIRPAVEADLRQHLKDCAGRFRKGASPSGPDLEQFHVELSEHQLAIATAMKHLFPDED